MRTKREHGQVIYILAIGIITLLGFSALAIDGARLFSERRNAQGVADTAAFTAAAYIGQFDQTYIKNNWTSGTKVEDHAEQAALERINSNGYTGAEYNPFGTNDRLRITINKEAETLSTNYLVRVFLISEVQPIFAQLIFPGDLLVNVEAHAIVMPQTNMAFGQALYSLNDTKCKAMSFSGNSLTHIKNSGIYANSKCSPNAIDFGGTAATVVNGAITTPGGIYDHGSGGYTATSELEGATPQPFPAIPVPNCSALPLGVIVDSGTTTTFFPGKYNAKIGITSAKSDAVFLPGLYCLYRGLSISNGQVSGSGVTFYVPTDDVKVTGGILNLTAPTAGEADDPDNSWDGMLFYVKEGSWEITGGAGTYLEGTVYAPGTPDPTCKLTGSGVTDSYNLQLVCDTISLIGGAGLTISYDGSNAYAPPVSIDLIE